jgi:hypothetical protein
MGAQAALISSKLRQLSLVETCCNHLSRGSLSLRRSRLRPRPDAQDRETRHAGYQQSLEGAAALTLAVMNAARASPMPAGPQT